MQAPSAHARTQSPDPSPTQALAKPPLGRPAAALLTLLTLAGAGRADVLTVDDDRVENPTATYTSIQAALADANPTDEVHVWPGTYTGTGSEVVLVDVPALRLIGQTSSGTVLIDGQGARRCLRVLGQGIDSTSSLDEPIHIEGLTLVNGDAVSSAGGGFKGNGGGAYLEGYVSLEDCTVQDCTSSRSGGGLSIEQPSYGLGSSSRYTAVSLMNCVIESCVADEDGAGLYNEEGALWARDVTVSANYAYRNGGGVAVSHRLSGETDFHGWVSWNRAERDGGGFHAEGPQGPTKVSGELNSNVARGGCGGGLYAVDTELYPGFFGLTLYENEADMRPGGSGGHGGGLYALRSTIKSTSLTLYRNGSEGDGGGMYLRDCPELTLLSGQFEENVSLKRGGAIATLSCDAVDLNDTAFLQNIGRVAGALHAVDTLGSIDSCSFLGNAGYMGGSWSGAAVAAVASSTSITISGTTFWQNTTKHLLEKNGGKLHDGGGNQITP